jgi:hypothetical protein
MFVDAARQRPSGEVAFDVAEGPQTKILETVFEGNVEASDATLPASEAEQGPRLQLHYRGTTNTESYAEDATALERFYRDRGYVKCRWDNLGSARSAIQRTRRISGSGWQSRSTKVRGTGSVKSVSSVTNCFTSVVDHLRDEPGAITDMAIEAARTELPKVCETVGHMDFAAYPT